MGLGCGAEDYYEEEHRGKMHRKLIPPRAHDKLFILISSSSEQHFACRNNGFSWMRHLCIARRRPRPSVSRPGRAVLVNISPTWRTGERGGGRERGKGDKLLSGWRVKRNSGIARVRATLVATRADLCICIDVHLRAARGDG
jgi:hypothetical protein